MKGKTIGDFVEHERCSVAILNACRVNLGLEKHAECVDQNMPFAALDLLACIIADIAAGIRAMNRAGFAGGSNS